MNSLKVTFWAHSYDKETYKMSDFISEDPSTNIFFLFLYIFGFFSPDFIPQSSSSNRFVHFCVFLACLILILFYSIMQQ